MKVSDESTIVINDGAPVKTSVQTPVEKTKKKGTFWQGVLVGGIPGIMLGSAGTVFAARTPVQDEEAPAEEPKEEAVEANVDEGAATVQEADPTSEGAAIPEIEETVEVAENVNDDMSFSEAFATARAEVGPGGVFVWNGNVYSTYYEEEWDNMTDEQKEDFSDALHNTASSNAEDSAVETSSPDYSDNYHEASNEEGGVEVLSDQMVETEEGQVIRVTGVEVDGHYGEVYDFDNDGQADAAMIDTNDDGTPDVAMVDENGDGYISEAEVYSMDESGMVSAETSSPDYSDNYHEASHEEGGVEVLSDQMVETEEGQVIRVTGVEVDGHYGEVYDFDNDGQADAAMIDTNDDGTPDVAMVDENGDGYISEAEVYSMDDSGMVSAGTSSPDYSDNYHEASHEEGGVEVVSDQMVATEDGQVIRVTGVEVDGHYGEVYDFDNDGQADAAMIDTNDDGAPDVAMVDENGDGYIGEAEVYNMEDPGMIAMNDQNPEDALYDGMPDYTNDADTSSFA